VVLSKPPAPAVAERIRQAARSSGKPCVIGFLGAAPDHPAADGLPTGSTLEEVAQLALSAVGVTAPVIVAPAGRRVSPPRRYIRGLFAGGTLCGEAAQILQAGLGEVCRSAVGGRLPAAHLCLDLGDEQYTRGRAHPMIDGRLRAEWLRRAGQDAETAVVLFDVILGYGASADPVSPLLDAMPRAGGDPVYIARVCGTAGDPQNRSDVVARLRAAGVVVAPTNSAAARLSMEIVQS
jgi:FdrA protein